MKTFFYILCILLITTSCNDDKKHAQEMFDRAQSFYDAKEYASAKQMLDSLKSAYPKEIDVLRSGLKLMREVNLSEQERTLTFSDSMLVVKEKEAEVLKKNLLFEKDTKYDEVGKFMAKQQQLEQNLQRSYIRSGVNERGELFMSSVYYGKPIKHSKLKITGPGGVYAETLEIPQDGATNYSFTDGGMTTEIVTYQNGKDNGVIAFICDNSSANLKAEYIGAKTVILPVREADKKALIEVRNLAIVLSDIDFFKKEIEKSKARIEYLNSKIQK